MPRKFHQPPIEQLLDFTIDYMINSMTLGKVILTNLNLFTHIKTDYLQFNLNEFMIYVLDEYFSYFRRLLPYLRHLHESKLVTLRF